MFALLPYDSDRPVKPLAEGPLHEAFLSPARDAEPAHIDRAPPSEIQERPGVDPPGADAKWIGGYWQWDAARNDFDWVTGTWRVPPPGRFWVNGYWKRDDQGWSRIPGFWSDRQTDRIDFRKHGPPADRPKELVGEAPDPDDFYVPGHYAPDGDGVVWKPGFWSKSQPGWAWVPAHWVHQAEGWVYQDGFWDRVLEDRGTLFSPARVAGKADPAKTVYQPVSQIAPESYGRLYGAFGRPTSSYDGYPGCYFDAKGNYYGYANYGSIGLYTGYLDYPYSGNYGYPYLTSMGGYGPGYRGLGGYGPGYGSGLGYGSYGSFGAYGLGYGGYGSSLGGVGLLGSLLFNFLGFGYGYPGYGFGYGFGNGLSGSYGLGYGGIGSYGLGFGGYGGIGGFGYPFGTFGGFGFPFPGLFGGYGFPFPGLFGGYGGYGGYGYGGHGFHHHHSNNYPYYPGHGGMRVVHNITSNGGIQNVNLNQRIGQGQGLGSQFAGGGMAGHGRAGAIGSLNGHGGRHGLMPPASSAPFANPLLSHATMQQHQGLLGSGGSAVYNGANLAHQHHVAARPAFHSTSPNPSHSAGLTSGGQAHHGGLNGLVPGQQAAGGRALGAGHPRGGVSAVNHQGGIGPAHAGGGLSPGAQHHHGGLMNGQVPGQSAHGLAGQGLHTGGHSALNSGQGAQIHAGRQSGGAAAELPSTLHNQGMAHAVNPGMQHGLGALSSGIANPMPQMHLHSGQIGGAPGHQSSAAMMPGLSHSAGLPLGGGFGASAHAGHLGGGFTPLTHPGGFGGSTPTHHGGNLATLPAPLGNYGGGNISGLSSGHSGGLGLDGGVRSIGMGHLGGGYGGMGHLGSGGYSSSMGHMGGGFGGSMGHMGGGMGHMGGSGFSFGGFGGFGGGHH